MERQQYLTGLATGMLTGMVGCSTSAIGGAKNPEVATSFVGSLQKFDVGNGGITQVKGDRSLAKRCL